MKVGLFIGNCLPESGGGHTFENEIFQSLVKLSAETDHRFVLFSSSKEPPQEISAHEHIQFISLYRDYLERLRSKSYRTYKAVLKKLRYPLSPFKIEGWYEDAILKHITANCIDIVWSLIPGCPTMEVPFITTVWDLEHRLQPYFPEVSVQGEWNGREQSYA